jgi:hypothetical protein
MTPRVRYAAGLLVVAAALLVAVCGLQYVFHVGSCGNGANSLASGVGPCPSGGALKIIAGVAGLLVAVFGAARLGPPATSLAFGLGFTLVGAMFAILGFVPAPGEDATSLGLAVGAPFLLAGLAGFAFTARSFRAG